MQSTSIWRIFFLLFFYSIATTLSSQPSNDFLVSKRFLGTEEQLGRHNISSCLKDPLGFYWLVSYAGLYRYDGQKCDYYPNQYFGLETKDLFKAIQTDRGQFLVFSKKTGGVSYDVIAKSIVLFDPVQNTIIPVEIFLENSLFKINDITNVIKTANKLYLITTHQHIYELINDKVQYVFSAPPGSKVVTLGKIDCNNTFYYLYRGTYLSSIYKSIDCSE